MFVQKTLLPAYIPLTIPKQHLFIAKHLTRFLALGQQSIESKVIMPAAGVTPCVAMLSKPIPKTFHLPTQLSLRHLLDISIAYSSHRNSVAYATISQKQKRPVSMGPVFLAS